MGHFNWNEYCEWVEVGVSVRASTHESTHCCVVLRKITESSGNGKASISFGFLRIVARSERFTSQFQSPFELNHLTISIILIAHEIFVLRVCVCIHNKSFNNPFVFHNKCVEDVRESVREIHLKWYKIWIWMPFELYTDKYWLTPSYKFTYSHLFMHIFHVCNGDSARLWLHLIICANLFMAN